MGKKNKTKPRPKVQAKVSLSPEPSPAFATAAVAKASPNQAASQAASPAPAAPAGTAPMATGPPAVPAPPPPRAVVQKPRRVPPAGFDLRPRVGLCLIVKNEAHIICELLGSVVPYIHYWVVLDTGSTDGTQDVIRKYMHEANIPGELHDRPWVCPFDLGDDLSYFDFGRNRTWALELCYDRVQYAWVMDADDLLHGAPEWGDLTADRYQFRIGDASATYARPQMYRMDSAQWHYKDPLHEYSACKLPEREIVTRDITTPGVWIESRRKGARSNVDPGEKYRKDAKVFERLLERRDRHNARWQYYYAQSLWDAREYERALPAFLVRAQNKDGFLQERYMAYYHAAECAQHLHRPNEERKKWLRAACDVDPARNEALYDLVRLLLDEQRYNDAYTWGRRGLTNQWSGDKFCARPSLYSYELAFWVAVAAQQLGRYQKAAEMYATLQDLIPPTDGWPETLANNMRLLENSIRAEKPLPAQLAECFRCEKCYRWTLLSEWLQSHETRPWCRACSA